MIDEELPPTLTRRDCGPLRIVGVVFLCATEFDSNDSIRRLMPGFDLISATIDLNCSRSFLASVEVTLDFRVSSNLFN